jgi:4'-phosphopantetheinyl transferase
MQTIHKWEKRILGHNEAHLWVYLDEGGALPGRTVEVLDLEEKQRLEEYRFADKRREFLMGRLFLKHVLAQYLEIYPARVKIHLDAEEKPFLMDQPFHFSISHSHGAYVCLIGGKSSGVDVEYLLREPLDSRAEHVFTKSEIAHLESLEEESREKYFFHLWTMKEAFWKALNRQKDIYFNQISVTFDPLSVSILSADYGDKSWYLAFEEGLKDYLIATAMEKKSGESIRLKTFQFSTPIQHILFAYP